ncbi:HNH endonuclease signature motif containing protein [Haloechinothrix halophila]|uniref:HNH endonuclease signature motif containing protein n=1 Tax=Haloechinothrix halophila TaxID=1069073 RepID=UPI0004052386|nr:HNH endonuclease signature motif containing protein [Haloechinothrix halophila]
MTGSGNLGAASGLTDAELIAALRKTEQQRHELYAEQLRLLTELTARNVAPEWGYADTAAIARDTLRLTPQEARRREKHARTLIMSFTPTGMPLDPELPNVAAAATEGVIGPEHIAAITDAVAKLPRPVNLDDRTAAEQILLDAAHHHAPNVIARLGREIHARLDQDGPPPDDREPAHPRRSLDLHETSEGRVYGRFDLDPETGGLLTNLLSPHTCPDNSSADGPDLRTKSERDADGLVEILRLAAANENGPSEAGEPVTVLVTVGLEQLERGLGAALLDSGAPMSASQIRRMACDAHVIPAVLGSRAELLDIGRKQRTIPAPIRRALIARDQGCAFPGCGRKAKWCHGHHIRHWADGGPTELNNLVLLCTRHHTTIHHTDWDVRIRDGVPEFIPPSWLDPSQTPIRNPLHQRRQFAA